ncbi:MAG: CHAT domain-containing protein [bacterium]|nr:CHAT domain-containing protein [bacterium]
MRHCPKPIRRQRSRLAMSWLATVLQLCPVIASAQSEITGRAALQDSVGTLQSQARYAEARILAERFMAVVSQDSTALPYEITDAQQILATMTTVAGLSREGQLAFAEADSLLWLVGDLYGQAHYGEAVALTERQLEIYTRLLGPDHPKVATCWNNLALLYSTQGQYKDAEPLYRRALAIEEVVLGPHHPDVATDMNNLALLYADQGRYALGEPLHRRAMFIRETALGPDHPDVATTLNGLALAYFNQGQYARAEPLFKRSLMIRETAGDPDSLAVATGLNNLALLHATQGHYVQAEPFYRRALAIDEKTLRPDHPYLAGDLGNLALLYAAQGQYDQAMTLHIRSLAILEKSLGPVHRDVALALNNLAQLHDAQGHFEQAEPLYRRALAIRERTLNPDHPDVVHSLVNLAGLYLSTGHPDSAAIILADAAGRFESARLLVGRSTARATFQESPYPSLAIASLSSGAFEKAWPAMEKSCGRALADLLVAARRRPLTESETAIEDGLERAVIELEPRLEALIRAAHIDSTPESMQREEATRLELLSAESHLSEFRQAMALRYPIAEGQSYPLPRVQAALGDKQAIVGWLDFEIRKGTFVSWVYVIRSRGPVAWVQLPGFAGTKSPSPFDQARACYDALDHAGNSDTIVAAFSAARVQPVLPALSGIEALVVVPTGAMATIPVEALVDELGRPLLDAFSISYAPSSTIYTWLHEESTGASSTDDRQAAVSRALLIGDPPYTPSQRAAMAAEGTDVVTVTASPVAAANLRSAVVGDEEALALLPRLRNSRTEVRSIAKLAGNTSVLLGPEASEQALVALADSGDLGAYRTIHIATHALVDQQRPERSCLVLSRVDLPDAYEAAKLGERIYDGRLTVQEILQQWELDADLVTLSACETGLGQDVRGEGLVGFAHAFLQAGAKSLLVSLWKVDDRATALLMTRFYENLWQQQMSKVAALREAKQWLRDYRDTLGQRPYANPGYWSGFVLVGSPR